MKLADLLESYSTNPFVSMTSSIDLRLRQVKSSGFTAASKFFVDSNVRQLSDLEELVQSAYKWNLPEGSLRKSFLGALPSLISSIKSAINHTKSGSFQESFNVLYDARSKFVTASKLSIPEVVNEHERGIQYLYHGCDLAALLSILLTNKMIKGGASINIGNKNAPHHVNTISFTRNPELWYRGNCLIVFDREKLKQKYKIRPFRDQFSSDVKDESEEILDKELTDVKKYIIEVKLSVQVYKTETIFDRFSDSWPHYANYSQFKELKKFMEKYDKTHDGSQEDYIMKYIKNNVPKLVIL